MVSRASPFQIDASERVRQIVQKDYADFAIKEAGREELYLVGEVVQLGLTLWIYEDELELKCPSKHVLLEKPDFGTPEEMISFFLEQLTLVLSGSSLKG